MPTAIPWSPWFVYTQAVPTSRYLPPEYFMDYELGFGGSNGSANSNDGEILRGRLGATVGFAYGKNILFSVYPSVCLSLCPPFCFFVSVSLSFKIRTTKEQDYNTS